MSCLIFVIVFVEILKIIASYFYFYDNFVNANHFSSLFNVDNLYIISVGLYLTLEDWFLVNLFILLNLFDF